MKVEIEKSLPIIIAIAVIANILFIVLTYTTHIYVFRILIQGSYALLLLLVGINHFFYKKQRVFGIYMLLASGVFLFMMVFVLMK
jgi:hypothetical protein